MSERIWDRDGSQALIDRGDMASCLEIALSDLSM
jgi:hypothetical protein